MTEEEKNLIHCLIDIRGYIDKTFSDLYRGKDSCYRTWISFPNDKSLNCFDTNCKEELRVLGAITYVEKIRKEVGDIISKSLKEYDK